MGEPSEGSATLVLSSYNHAPFVADALASYAAQDHADLRLIVIDDASTDDTVAVIERELTVHGLAATAMFHTANAGVCATFNEALARVETPFVAFLAADDWMEPTRFSRQVSELVRRPEAAMVYSDQWVVHDDTSVEPTLYSTICGRDWPAGEHPDLYRALLRTNWIPAPSALCRTECLRTVGGYDESMPYEDYDMWLRLAAHGYSFAYVDEPLVYYRRSADTMTERFNRLSSIEQDLMDLQILGKQLGTDPEVDSWLAPRLLHMAVVNYKRGSRSPVLAHTLRRCMRVAPSLAALRYATAATVTQRGRRR